MSIAFSLLAKWKRHLQAKKHKQKYRLLWKAFFQQNLFLHKLANGIILSKPRWYGGWPVVQIYVQFKEDYLEIF